MRIAKLQGCVVGLLAVAGIAIPALAQPDPEPRPVHIDECATSGDHLGISRVVEIDTKGGPHFGGSQGGHNSFLEPGEVLLTFDDGPMRAHTRAVLKALADQCTKATFFMVGRMAVAAPDMVKEVADAGHTVGSHTWSHKNLGILGVTRGRQEVEAAISAITAGGGKPISPFFRYPYLSGSKTVDAYTRTRDIATFWIDVDSKDYTTRDPNSVIRRVMAQLEQKGKGIILMHDIQVSTVRALPRLLDELHAKGYRVVHAVPKSDLSTVAEYDAIAEKALAAKAEKTRVSKLADRAVTWAADPEPVEGQRHHPKSVKRATPTTKPASSEALPWGTAPAAKQKKPSKPAHSELPWQSTIFGY